MKEIIYIGLEPFIEIILADDSKKTVRNDRLFIKDDTTPMNPDSLTEWVSKFVRKNIFPHFSPHSLRHTHATILIANGVNFPIVSRRLGHSSISTTIPVPNSNTKIHAVPTDKNNQYNSYKG